MNLEKANKQLILLTPITYIIFIINCIIGYLTDKTTQTPLIVSIVLGLVSCIALFFIYKANKVSKLIKYITFAGLYINHLFLMIATEISLSNFIVFIILITMSLMFFDKKFTYSILAIAILTHVVFTVSKMSDNINMLDILLNLLILVGLICTTYISLRIYGETVELVKINTGKITGNFRNVGDIANYIYEKVTQLESETKILRKGSNEFQVSLKDVTKAIEDIAAGSSSIIADTEKIALHVDELEKTLSDNREHIRCVTENMDRIIDIKNQGLKLMSELSNITEITSNAVAEINKMVNETSDNTNKIVSAGEYIKHIAAQTNLLALNAAIEASAAGQSNTGFAVIAEEIRSLSAETNRYVKEIQNYTTALAESVVSAVNALNKVNSAIENEINGVKDMDDLLDKIHESTTSTQNYIVKLNESGETILEQAKEIKELITNLYAVNQENSANMNQASNSMSNQNPYVDSLIKLVNNLCDMAYNLRDKSMEIKMLIDAGLLIDYLDAEGYSNDNLIEACRKLNITTAYVADETGYVHYCNEEIGRGVNLFKFDKNFKKLLGDVDYIASPIKRRAEDGKMFKFLSVSRNKRIYELGIDLSGSQK
ncbi:MAG TPA: hypothetical protein GXX20_03545 [Clostridiaceae bacterium]|nr:hypothetical protein [Clostridiaceae bacterium]